MCRIAGTINRAMLSAGFGTRRGTGAQGEALDSAEGLELRDTWHSTRT